MTRFLTAPSVSISPVIGIVAFKLQSEIETKIQKEVVKLKTKLTPELCSNERELIRVKNELSSILNYVNQIENRTGRLQKVIDPLQVLLTSISAGILILELLPTPNIGTTVGVTSKFAELLINLRKLNNEIRDEVNLVSTILLGTKGLVPAISKVKLSIQEIDTFIKNCGDTNLTEINTNITPLETFTFNFIEDYQGFRIQLEVVDESKVAPIRRAIAVDSLGITRFTSDNSFSATTDVLVNEVKFKIDNNILS